MTQPDGHVPWKQILPNLQLQKNLCNPRLCLVSKFSDRRHADQLNFVLSGIALTLSFQENQSRKTNARIDRLFSIFCRVTPNKTPNVNHRKKMTEEYENDQFGLYEAFCRVCDEIGMVNDIGLCEECDAKMDRDLIRKREWDYSASAFGCPEEKREELRNHIIKQYGRQLELLAEDDPEDRQ